MTEKTDYFPNFCPSCGLPIQVERKLGRSRPFCNNCEEVVWQNPKPVAGVFVLDGEKVLLIKRGIKPHKGKWSIPAGYLERDESPDMAAVRELEEETGLRAPVEDIFFVDHVVFEHPDGQHLLASVYGAELENTSGEVIAGDDAAEARFWTLDNLAEDRDKLEYNEYVRLIEKSQEILGQR